MILLYVPGGDSPGCVPTCEEGCAERGLTCGWKTWSAEQADLCGCCSALPAEQILWPGTRHQVAACGPCARAQRSADAREGEGVN